jgi:hypothetical protein
VRGIVDARKIEPLTLKGSSHPVQAYEVLAVEEPVKVPDTGSLSSSRFVGEEYHEKHVQIRSLSAMRA